MKSKVLRIVFGITCSFCFVSLVAALPPNVVSFSLKNKGDKQTITDHFNEGNRKVSVYFKKSGNGTIGLSLDKMGIFGWSFVNRCNMTVNTNTEGKSCSYGKQSTGTYRGTVVINTTTSGEYIGHISIS